MAIIIYATWDIVENATIRFKSFVAIATVAAKNVLIAPTIATTINANSLNSNIGELLIIK